MPAIISWPGRLPEGEVRSQLATACDWVPTILELCDAKPVRHEIDGLSLKSVLQSESAPTPHDVFHWQTGGNQWAVRQGDWKLIGNPRDTSNKAPLGKGDKLFLINLAEDVSEMKNLAADHPDVVERLQKLHDAWAGQFK